MMPFLVSFVITALATPGVIALAWRMGWVARPRKDRWHCRPTALMGGIAIFLGTTTSWLTICDTHVVAPITILAAAMFLFGVADDHWLEFRPHQKLMGQTFAAVALIAAGIKFEALPTLVALPLTLLWVIGITNAVNLLDNMDGLAAGVAGIAALVLAAYCLGEGATAMVPAVLALAGGCAGFLIYNFNPARVFMGDCGSMFIGFTLAALAVHCSAHAAPSRLLALLIPVAVLAVPIFDTTLVAMARFVNGRPIMPGFHDHSSHRMVALGLSERWTVVFFYALTALSGGLALGSTRLPLPVVLVAGALLFFGLVMLGLYLGFLKVYPEPVQAPPAVHFLRTRLLYKTQFLQVVLDLLLIPLAFVGAHLLRFEGQLPFFIADGLLATLPFVFVAKLVGLALCRAYRGVWRCAGMADALSAVAGSTAGSLLALGFLAAFTGFSGVSRSALIVDWLLLTPLVVAARLGHAILQQLFELLPARGEARVLILGAGEEAVGLIHRLRDPVALNRAYLVGILDEAPIRHGRTLNGVPVLGPLSALPLLVASRNVTHCLLGIPPHSPAAEQILATCRRCGIDLQEEPGMPLATAVPRVAAAA